MFQGGGPPRSEVGSVRFRPGLRPGPRPGPRLGLRPGLRPGPRPPACAPGSGRPTSPHPVGCGYATSCSGCDMTQTVLVLNADWTPLRVVPWERAVTLLLE